MNFCLFTSEDIKKLFSRPAPEEMTWLEKRVYSAEEWAKKAVVVWYAGIVAYGFGTEIARAVGSFF